MLRGLTPETVAAVLAQPKHLSKRMRWTKKLSNHNPQWYQFDSAIETDGEALEAMKVRCQWRPAVDSKPENFVCGLYINDMRVYAVDVQPDKPHKNPVLAEHPYSGLIISGIHEHLWTAFRDRYAEPINNLVEHAAAWAYFCRRAGIADTPFVEPVSQKGQMSLL